MKTPSFALGGIGLVAGALIGVFTTAATSPEIGISFKDSHCASLRQENGQLPKDQLDQAVSKAVEQYIATGLKTPVIVDLPNCSKQHHSPEPAKM